MSVEDTDLREGGGEIKEMRGGGNEQRGNGKGGWGLEEVDTATSRDLTAT